MLLKVTKLSAFDNLEIKQAAFKKNSFPAHFHDTYSIGIIKEGVENLTIKENSRIAYTGTIVVINPYEVHSNTYFNNEIWRFDAIYINHDIISFLNPNNNSSATKPPHFQNIIKDKILFEQIEQFVQLPLLKKEKSLNTIVNTLLLQYVQNPAEEIPISLHERDIAYEIKTHLDNHLQQKINFNLLAKKCFINQRKLIACFKKETGLTPASYLILKRLTKSKELISQKLPLVEVALECGFYDQSHFNHYFRKFFGVTPFNYKRNSVIL